jgi:hypothetical protein
MKARTKARLARLEARWVNSTANENDVIGYEFKSIVMSMVAFYAGEWTPGDSLAIALARGLDMTAGELKDALSPNNDDNPNIWPRVLEKLNAIIAARGGHPVTENGSLILERSPQGGRRNGLEVLDELYAELPERIKERHRLLPCFADLLL